MQSRSLLCPIVKTGIAVIFQNFILEPNSRACFLDDWLVCVLFCFSKPDAILGIFPVHMDNS